MSSDQLLVTELMTISHEDFSQILPFFFNLSGLIGKVMSGLVQKSTIKAEVEQTEKSLCLESSGHMKHHELVIEH